MDLALTASRLALLGALLLAAWPAGAVETHRVFVSEGYRYVPDGQEVSEKAAQIGLELCSTRCGALADDYYSYLKTMNWRLTLVKGVTERVVDLGNPFLGGQCICSGREYEAEYYYFRPGKPPSEGTDQAGGGKRPSMDPDGVYR